MGIYAQHAIHHGWVGMTLLFSFTDPVCWLHRQPGPSVASDHWHPLKVHIKSIRNKADLSETGLSHLFFYLPGEQDPNL